MVLASRSSPDFPRPWSMTSKDKLNQLFVAFNCFRLVFHRSHGRKTRTQTQCDWSRARNQHAKEAKQNQISSRVLVWGTIEPHPSSVSSTKHRVRRMQAVRRAASWGPWQAAEADGLEEKAECWITINTKDSRPSSLRNSHNAEDTTHT